MNSKNRLEVSRPEAARRSIEPSLRDGGKASYQVEEHENGLAVGVDAKSLGVLRACNDTMFRLSMLHSKVMNR